MTALEMAQKLYPFKYHEADIVYLWVPRVCLMSIKYSPPDSRLVPDQEVWDVGVDMFFRKPFEKDHHHEESFLETEIPDSDINTFCIQFRKLVKKAQIVPEHTIINVLTGFVTELLHLYFMRGIPLNEQEIHYFTIFMDYFWMRTPRILDTMQIVYKLCTTIQLLDYTYYQWNSYFKNIFPDTKLEIHI